MSANKQTMPFGKHKGKILDDVPADYLLWLHENSTNLNGSLKDYIDDNLDSIKSEAADLKAEFLKNKK
jgi:uncharacterized protein (DUF3820 family)